MPFKIKLTPARCFFAVITIACMIGIFIFSMDNSTDSTNKSNTITETAVEVFVRDYDDLSPDKKTDVFNTADFIIRKLAHFLIYTSLGFFASLTAGKRRILSEGSFYTFLFCVLYACSDEIHQHFVPGRACRIMDVCIDSGGAATGILCSFVAMAIANIIINHFHNKKSPVD